MGDFNIRPDSVNVEHIMQQIRARVREKRGVDYTEQQIRDLAAGAFERFLGPERGRPELLEQFRQGRVPPVENYSFEDTTLFESHRASLRWIRRLLRPLLKLFFNPNPLIQVLHEQSGINARYAESTGIVYELLYNLVLETTRLEVEVKTLKMRVESTASRLDFAERRGRPTESRAPHRTEAATDEPPARGRSRDPQAAAAQPAAEKAGPTRQPVPARDAEQGGAAAEARRRRRRRRGRRGGTNRPGAEGGAEGSNTAAETDADAAPTGGAAQAPEGGGPDESTGRAAAPATPPPSDHEDQ
jgi:hypothetical protein